MTPARIGLLGGAFDPPHEGHLRLATLALEHLALDELRFVPAAHAPRKDDHAATPAARLRLLEAALGNLPGCCRVDPIEIVRGGTSYTVDTLEALAAREPGRSWIWLLGSDQLAQFERWQRGDRILELASLAVAPRPGHDDTAPPSLAERERRIWSGAPGELVWLPSTRLDLSSSRLREDLSGGRAPGGVPIQVQAAIDRENLYR